MLVLAEGYGSPPDTEKIMIGAFLLIPLLACKVPSQVPSAADPPVEASPGPAVEESGPSSGIGVSGEGALRQKCIDACVASRQMEAVAIEMIEESCAQGCAGEPQLLPMEKAPEPPPSEAAE